MFSLLKHYLKEVFESGSIHERAMVILGAFCVVLFATLVMIKIHPILILVAVLVLVVYFLALITKL